MAFTFFFRDNTVLEAAADLFVRETMGRSRVRIWDAGCAMGPEPYTLLIMLAERMGKFSFENLRLDATDHDESGFFGDIIMAGRYPEEQLCRIPGALHAKYFSPVPGLAGQYEISPKLRSRISYRRHDLLSLDAPGDGYAMIVCKNVLLHFSEEQRTKVIAMFLQSLAPGGILVMEHTQKMPLELLGPFSQATPEAQIYRKEAVEMAVAA
jgi:chemotaxis protein methyltransferase CheR